MKAILLKFSQSGNHWKWSFLNCGLFSLFLFLCWPIIGRFENVDLFTIKKDLRRFLCLKIWDGFEKVHQLCKMYKCKKNAKQNVLMYFEFWKHFSLFTYWKTKYATRIQNILTHSVWHFSYICDYKGSWWTKTTNPHFTQKVRETYWLPSAF